MANRFIGTDGGLEDVVKIAVQKNFPSADQASLGGSGFRTLAAEGQLSDALLNIRGQEFLGEASKNFMCWSTSRWGGKHIVR